MTTISQFHLKFYKVKLGIFFSMSQYSLGQETGKKWKSENILGFIWGPTSEKSIQVIF